MDPSLREIIAQAVADARRDGLDPIGQRRSAVALLMAMLPSVDRDTVRLIVDQLYPLIAEFGAAA